MRTTAGSTLKIFSKERVSTRFGRGGAAARSSRLPLPLSRLGSTLKNAFQHDSDETAPQRDRLPSPSPSCARREGVEKRSGFPLSRGNDRLQVFVADPPSPALKREFPTRRRRSEVVCPPPLALEAKALRRDPVSPSPAGTTVCRCSSPIPRAPLLVEAHASPKRRSILRDTIVKRLPSQGPHAYRIGVTEVFKKRTKCPLAMRRTY